MKVAVYDTHVTKKNGGTTHFDIIVSEEIPWEKVPAFGKDYLQRVGQEGQPLSARGCEFCRIEQASPTGEQSIRTSPGCPRPECSLALCLLSLVACPKNNQHHIQLSSSLKGSKLLPWQGCLM